MRDSHGSHCCPINAGGILVVLVLRFLLFFISVKYIRPVITTVVDWELKTNDLAMNYLLVSSDDFQCVFFFAMYMFACGILLE